MPDPVTEDGPMREACRNALLGCTQITLSRVAQELGLSRTRQVHEDAGRPYLIKPNTSSG